MRKNTSPFLAVAIAMASAAQSINEFGSAVGSVSRTRDLYPSTPLSKKQRKARAASKRARKARQKQAAK